MLLLEDPMKKSFRYIYQGALLLLAFFIAFNPLQTRELQAFPAFPTTSYKSLNAKGMDKNHPPAVQSLIEEFTKKGYDLQIMVDDSRFQLYEGIGDRFRNSAERKSPSFEEYKQRLGYEDKKSRITGFIQTHYDQLVKAEETYNIPLYVIAAIIGIESDYGKNIGRYNPLNVYISMYAENYRADFAKAQLEELLKFVSRNELDVFDLKSSYAGAMSYGQFIPYSLNRWFVGDDIFDMNNNIMSIGNYLAHFLKITGSIDGAVMRYNPSRLYTDAVLSLAREAEALYTQAM